MSIEYETFVIFADTFFNGLIDTLYHEIVYHKHKELDYDIMTDVVVNEIVNILK